MPADAAHWRQIPTAGGNVWVDLNARGTFKFSDADFPAVAGWNCYDDDTRPDDQRCDSSHLKRRIRALMQSDANRSEPGGDRAALAKGLGTRVVRQSLRRTICKFPSEWDRGTIAARYEWLRDPQLGFGLDHPENWERFAKHLEAVSFPDLPQGYKDAVWHVYPTQFIVHMRQCGWLAKEEIKQIYASTGMDVIEEYAASLNEMTRKYSFNNSKMLSHLFGQGAVESASFTSMQERAMFGKVLNGQVLGTSINPASATNERSYGHWWGQGLGEIVDWHSYTQVNSRGHVICSSYDNRMGNQGRPDGQKFRGRGFKQLTGRSNYADYWKFRGWIPATSNAVDNPQVIATDPYNCMDSGGWYLTFQRPGIRQAIEKDIDHPATSVSAIELEKQASKTVTRAINGGYTDWERRLDKTREAKKVLMDI